MGIEGVLIPPHNALLDWRTFDRFAMNALISISVGCDRRDIYNEAIRHPVQTCGAETAEAEVSAVKNTAPVGEHSMSASRALVNDRGEALE
jgi:hypothetical protein